MHLKRLLTGAILVVWLTLVGVTYWRMELRFLRPVERPAGAASVDPCNQPAAPVRVLHPDRGAFTLRGKITLLNFWSPNCACSRFMEPHVRDLVKQFTPRGVQIITVIIVHDERVLDADSPGQLRGRGIETPMVVDRGGALARRFGVWAAPAAVIANPQGQIIYTGAYNLGRYCSNEATAFAKQALEAALEGRKPPRASTPFYGCQVPSAR
ncbi:MAG: hypothetical protein KatS3mg019_0436 [Fimbriimonadales bacterium]|nr:MAG: hypothetical protein KatS3mg019_0436 [Fimbriimonadales bacterium]